MSQHETQTSEQLQFDDKLPFTRDYAFCKVMEDNPELCNEIEGKIREAIKAVQD